ncbi:MAG: phage portal protein, partial [Phycisphaeraceae bacterium]
DQSPESDHLASLYNEPEFIAADLVAHRFQRNEPGQVRGIPWLAPCLQVIADIRDGDNEILDAVRNAAEFAVFGEATGPDVDFVAVNESTDLERRTLKMMAPGYSVKGVQANQPNTSYLDFRDERIREIGAPVQMPLLRVKHDASDHNYSSARFDDLGYWRGIGRTRHWISSRDLAPLLRKVEREARLSQISAGLAVPRPKDFRSVQLMWHWPQPQRLDLNREWSGLGIQRALGALSFDQMLDSTGTNRDQYLAQEKRSRAAFEKAGIPYPEMDQVLKAIKILGDAESIDQPANKKTRDKPAPTPKEAASASA